MTSTNDKYIRQLLNDPNYCISPVQSSLVLTLITKTGKVSVKKQWRECSYIKNGYKTLKYKYKELRVPRVIYMKYGSVELRPNMLVAHLDGNTLNDDIKNLYPMTQSGINFDRFKRKPPVMGNTKLTWVQVYDIRVAHRMGDLTYSQLAKFYKISKGHVSEIINGKIWIVGKQYALSKNVEPNITGELPNQNVIT